MILIKNSKNRIWAFGLSLLLSNGALASEYIISDIDDTVKLTDVAHTGDEIRREFFSERAFAGMSTLYQEIESRNSGATLYFITGSPKQLGFRVKKFVEDNHFPTPNEVLLRELSIATPEFKTQQIEKLLTDLPASAQLILIGDDGEKDPETYAGILQNHPTRVAAVYIHRIKGRVLPAGENAFDTAMDIAMRELKRGALTAEQALKVGNAVLHEGAAHPESLVMNYAFCPTNEPEVYSAVLVSANNSDSESPSAAQDDATELAETVRSKVHSLCDARAEQKREQELYRE